MRQDKTSLTRSKIEPEAKEDAMGSLGWPELLIIALIAVVLFGAGRLADIGKGLGQGIKHFKKGLKEAEEIGKEVEEPSPKKLTEKKEA
ncbi:MAG TPA: twin-arginine translocase TatA/TatE family subunit [Polyangiaceae bacterium]|nr:twin-arginine translocase TatA/TatE family subunit [Polyangiaceae bacterium]